MNDLAIRGGLLVTPEGEKAADIGIEGGKIAQIGGAVTAAEEIDAGGMILLPGMIDTHVHIRGGAFSHREDFRTGTRAAVSGGVTTLLEMPVAKPPASTPEAFTARVREAESVSVANVALYGGAGADNIAEIPKLAQLGAVGYKTFLMPPPEGREAEFYGLCAEDLDALVRVMEAVEQTGLTLACHAEDNGVVAPYTKEVMATGRGDLEAWENARPREAELTAIRRVIQAAGLTGCKTVVCHISTPEGIALVREAKNRGVHISTESCPSYLAMDYASAHDAGIYARIKPPLRSPDTRVALLGCLRRGEIDIIGSDHAPYLPEEKERGGNIWKTLDGMPGLELSLLQLLNLVAWQDWDYTSLAKVAATRAAEIFGLAGKGAVREGKDADLVLVRKCETPWTVELLKLHTKAKGSAVCYENLPMSHRVEATLIGGRPVFRGGELLDAPTVPVIRSAR